VESIRHAATPLDPFRQSDIADQPLVVGAGGRRLPSRFTMRDDTRRSAAPVERVTPLTRAVNEADRRPQQRLTRMDFLCTVRWAGRGAISTAFPLRKAAGSLPDWGFGVVTRWKFRLKGWLQCVIPPACVRREQQRNSGAVPESRSLRHTLRLEGDSVRVVADKRNSAAAADFPDLSAGVQGKDQQDV